MDNTENHNTQTPENKTDTPCNFIFHKASTRGYANHGWLESHHTFSFANYHDAERVQFGALRVLNDDKIDGAMGFGMHPHENMEIITIPLEGSLFHKDSMGNTTVIKNGDIQVMSAGTGIFHSEYNNDSIMPVKLLQIWVYPNKKDVTPRYDQISLNINDRTNNFQQILSPNPNNNGVWIYQEAWFYLGYFNKTTTTKHQLHHKNNGVYLFIISGSATIQSQKLSARDGFGIWNTQEISIIIDEENTEVLLMEVPMQ